jgi:hypothetical protein
MRFALIAAVLACCTIAISAQDPTKAAPDAYKLQFENAFIKILRVHYAPHSKVPVHDHSRFPAAYVYLVNSGPIRFVHTGWDEPVLTRPATKAGSFRLSPTRFEDETHAVENPGDTASDFLRIEIKTEAPDRKSLYGRFDAYKGDRRQGLGKVEFENSQLRVTRLISKPGDTLNVTATAAEPSFLVILTAYGEIPVGQTFWLAPGETKTFDKAGLANRNASQVELLRFDLKTKPQQPK